MAELLPWLNLARVEGLRLGPDAVACLPPRVGSVQGPWRGACRSGSHGLDLFVHHEATMWQGRALRSSAAASSGGWLYDRPLSLRFPQD